MKIRIAWAVLGAIALDAAAQQSRPPHPSDANVRVPESTYRSAFEGYVSYREQPLVPWREVNEDVARAGGHIGIFRGAVQGGSAPAAAKSTPGERAPAAKEPKAEASRTVRPRTPAGVHMATETSFVPGYLGVIESSPAAGYLAAIETSPARAHAGRSAWLLLAVLALGGCASFSPDGGFDAVTKATEARGVKQQPQWIRNEDDGKRARETVVKLLASPLSVDAAVQIALLANPALQAAYADLGIAEADLVQAGRLRNPGFSFTRLRRSDELEIERTFMFDVLGLITMPLRTQLERQRFEMTQSRTAEQILRVAADTRQAWYRAVAAAESVRYAEQVKEAAEASAELARRMAAAGNFSKLDHAREQVFHAEATAQLARARQSAVSERERLTQLLGLWGDDIGFKLPERLPELPSSTRTIADIEPAALRQRLDVRSAMQEAESLAAGMDLTRTTGFISVLELGYQRNSETGQPRQSGYEIELRLPIFDWGTARNARAQLAYMQAVNRAADTAVKARSEVREAYFVYRTAFDLAKHYRDEIVPLRRRIAEENVLRYNGMLISVFELLADARSQIASVNAYIEALREFWLSDAALELALTGTSPGPLRSQPSASTATTEAAGNH